MDQIENFEGQKRGAFSEVFKYFHSTSSRLTTRILNETGHHYYVTPSMFLDLLNNFKKIFTKKRRFVSK